MTFFLLLCVLSSLNATLSEEQKNTFKTLYGTSNLRELRNIEQNPKAFWYEREKALTTGPEKIIPYKEFCRQFVQEAQNFLETEHAQSDTTLWFQNEGALDEVLRSTTDDESAAYPTIVFTLYACACDYAHNPQNTMVDFIRDKNKTLETMRSLQDTPFLTHAFNEKIVWCVKDAHFPIFDSLVMRSKNLSLCGIAQTFQERFKSKAHGGHFFGCFGASIHDVLSHAYAEDYFERSLAQYGISQQQYFHATFNPDVLVKGNIRAFSEQNFGVFYNFHEGPATTKHLTQTPSKTDLLLPTPETLTDEDLIGIIPFIVDLPTGDSMAKHTVFTDKPSASSVNTLLLEWRDKYCTAAERFMTTPQGTYEKGILQTFPPVF